MPDPKATVNSPAVAETPVPVKPGTDEEKKTIPPPNIPAPPKTETLPQATANKNLGLPLAEKKAVATNSPGISNPIQVTQDQKKTLEVPKGEKKTAEFPKPAPTEEGRKTASLLKPEKKPEPPMVSSQAVSGMERKNTLKKQRAEDIKDMKKTAASSKSTPTVESKKPAAPEKVTDTVPAPLQIEVKKNAQEREY